MDICQSFLEGDFRSLFIRRNTVIPDLEERRRVISLQSANQKKAKRARWLIHQGLYQKANQTIQSTVSLVADDTSAPALASKFPSFDTDYPIPTKPDCY